MPQDGMHRPWCDQHHATIDSPSCSAIVGTVEGISVMIFDDQEGHESLAMAGADGHLLINWPLHFMVQLVRYLEEGLQILRGTWPPIDRGWLSGTQGGDEVAQ